MLAFSFSLLPFFSFQHLETSTTVAIRGKVLNSDEVLRGNSLPHIGKRAFSSAFQSKNPS